MLLVKADIYVLVGKFGCFEDSDNTDDAHLSWHFAGFRIPVGEKMSPIGQRRLTRIQGVNFPSDSIQVKATEAHLQLKAV